jgi:hypothetical protein
MPTVPRVAALIALNLLTASLVLAQPCTSPAPERSKEPNIFTEEQENDLGDAVAEQLVRDFRILDDPQVTGHLDRIGARLIRHLPATQLHFQFFVIELPEANAFVLPGGRVFVSRKLIAFTQNEDELAGVMAHEMGHLLARQQTISMTRAFKEILGVTSVADRADIVEKYHRLLDNAARGRVARRAESHEDADQIAADRLGLFVLAAAGYDVQAYTRLYDRFNETKGDTGGFFSNLFGTTAPESRRLRELIRAGGTLPAGCADQLAAVPDEYRKWQVAVVTYAGRGRKEALHGVITRAALDPPLLGEMQHLRFSPDGQFILAQDDSGIAVVSREPFKYLFRVDAPEAADAHFTPDSRRLVFLTSDLRVESWNVRSQSLQEVHDLVVRRSCVQSELSPGGDVVACLEGDWTLSLYDVASGTALFQKRDFYEPTFLALLEQLSAAMASDPDRDPDVEFVKMGFSTDGRFFAAGYHRPGEIGLRELTSDQAIAYDLQAHAPVALKGGAKKLVAGGFAFIGPDRLIGANRQELPKSGTVALPAGEVVSQMPLPRGDLAAATSGEYLFVRPFQKYAVAVLSLAKQEIVKGSERAAIDFHDAAFVAERGSGELGLYNAADNSLKASTVVPPGTLGRVRAAALSTDFRYLAISEKSRGAVWDLHQKTRPLHVRGFRGAAFDERNQFLADIRDTPDSPRRIVRVDLDRKVSATAAPLRMGERVVQYGDFLLVTLPAKSGAPGLTIEVRTAATGMARWTRTLTAETPRLLADADAGVIVLRWPASSAAARDEAKKNPRLKTQLEALDDKDGDYFLQFLDARTGDPRGAMFVESGKGSVLIRDVKLRGDSVVVLDSALRTRVYSLSSGQQAGRVFGTPEAISEAGAIAVENGAGQLALYDLATLRPRDSFTFASPVTFAKFSVDGKRLFVLTGDQTTFVLDATGAR